MRGLSQSRNADLELKSLSRLFENKLSIRLRHICVFSADDVVPVPNRLFSRSRRSRLRSYRRSGRVRFRRSADAVAAESADVNTDERKSRFPGCCPGRSGRRGRRRYGWRRRRQMLSSTVEDAGPATFTCHNHCKPALFSLYISLEIACSLKNTSFGNFGFSAYKFIVWSDFPLR